MSLVANQPGCTEIHNGFDQSPTGFIWKTMYSIQLYETLGSICPAEICINLMNLENTKLLFSVLMSSFMNEESVQWVKH